MTHVNEKKNVELKTTKIFLTSKEKSELIIEGFITIILLVLLNLAIFVLLSLIITTSSEAKNFVWGIKTVLSDSFNNPNLLSLQRYFVFILLIADVCVLYWRLKRRYNQMQLRHVISELHYIADGHYDHRVAFEVGGDLGKIIESINGLVNSTTRAMAEERRIEQSKDELITNVSHDIRTPLTSIIGYLGLIEDKQYHSEEEILKYTHTAYVKAKQMKLMVDDLFEYTKVRQPSTPLNLTKFDMKQLLEQLAVDFELEAAKTDMEISVLAEPSPFLMEGDTDKLVRVFNNLLTNGLKYGKEGNRIRMLAEKVGSEAIITIQNNGTPIPKKALNQLFDRFFRVEESRSTETGGSGLGLAIAQSIIVLHGGYIYAKSDDNWTSFIMHLPLSRNLSN